MVVVSRMASFVYFAILGVLAALNAVSGGYFPAPTQFIVYQLLILGAVGGIVWTLLAQSRVRRAGDADRRHIAAHIAERVVSRREKDGTEHKP